MMLNYSGQKNKGKTLAIMLAFLLSTFIVGCNSNNKNSTRTFEKESRSYLLNLLNKNQKDSAFSLSNAVLKGLLFQDSLKEYISLNKVLYDSLLLKKGYDSTKKFLLNIIREESRLPVNDSLYQKILANAYYQYAVRLDGTQFSDTIISFFEKAGLINSRIKVLNPFHQVYIYKGLGIQYNIAGDMLKAFRNYNLESIMYQSIAQDHINYNYLSGSIINEAILLEEMNEHDSAICIINNIMPVQAIPEIKRAHLFVRRSYSEMCNKNLSSCKESLSKAEKIISNYYCKSSKDSSDLNELESEYYTIEGKIFLAEKKFSQAVSAFKKAFFRKSKQDDSPPRYSAKILVELGNIFLIQHNPDSANVYFQHALSTIIPRRDFSDVFSFPAPSQLYAENTILEALDAKANVLQLLYKQNANTEYLTTAIQCYTLSFEVEKKLMQYFSYDESKLLMLSESRQRSQKAINLCYQLYQLTKDNQWAQKAFQFAEKNKAFVLLESVKRSLATNTALQNDTLYQNTQKLQLQLAYTERSLAEATGDSAKQKLQQQKTKLENNLLFANTALGRQSVAYKTVMEKEDSISAASVSAGLLNEHTGLIEFFNADTVSYGFVLNKDQPIQFIQYSTTLSAEIDSLLYFFKSASAISNQPLLYQKMANQLYRTLQFDQLDRGWQNLIIIPDGKLSFLPFDALITNTAFTVNLQQAAYFLNQCNTLYGYSAAILLKQLHSNQPRYNNTTVFAPVFSNNENHQQPLLYSLQEADAIAANNNTTSFVKEKATLGNFVQQFTNPGILHIATHAYADTGANNNPKIEFIDSSLLLNELYAMHSNASLVVLSACETGLGRLNTSEGPMSLARGFYYAGAKNVITSYWNVDDKSTALLFTSFYKNINSSTSSDAIYSSKKELIKNENGKFASPYYWAGFVHIGMPQKKESGSYWWWLLLLLLPVAGFMVYRLRR